MWSLQQVEGLAPDAAALKTGRSVADPRKWSLLGRSERALWGLCQGSGKVPYQAQVDLCEPAFRCSCPSRKFPCKHGLGLMLMWAARPQALNLGEPPGWVSEWLAGRDQRAARKTVPAGPPDEAAAQKRVEAREARVEEGIAFARGWLEDLQRAGLASASSWPEAHWNTAAARLVDLQAPGLARLIRRIPELLGRPEALALHLGRLHLLLEGTRRPGQLEGEIRSRLGWNQSQEEVLAQPGVADVWMVVGQRQSEQDHLVVQRTWLQGRESRRHALILDFAPVGRPLPRLLSPGLMVRASACFYHGGQRALLREPEVEGRGGLPAAGSLQDDFARALSENPWLEEFPAVLGGACPGLQGLILNGRLIPYRQPFGRLWELMALSGGGPVTVFGEWDGRQLRPLTVWSEWGCEVLCG